MKKRNVIVVGLLSLSILTGCTTNKIERSQQDIKQEKVEKAKKEIANENKREKASSTKLIIPNSTQTESIQTESTQTESTQTESTQETYSTTQSNENTNSEYKTISQQGHIISCTPAWWRECNSNGHKTSQGVNTQNGKYCWNCIDCNKAVGYEKCNDHNTPATPEHMQLHLK